MATVAKKKYKIIIHIFFILLCLLYVLPLWLVVSISFSSEASITANNSGYSLIPKDFSTEAYKLAFQNPQSMVSAYWITASQAILGTVLSCIPEFWLSLLLILIFAIELRVLPSSGAYSIGQQNNIADRAAHLILPLAVVVLGHLWYYAYMIRNRLLDEMRADYVLLAKAKGLTRRTVMLRHCLRNTMPTYLSIMAISVPHVLGGTYIVETVFSYPGLGTLAYESARYKDYNLLMLLSLLSGALVILCSIIAQTVNEQIDPRIRAEQTVREAEAQP